MHKADGILTGIDEMTLQDSANVQHNCYVKKQWQTPVAKERGD
jgi:hypothetical protein